MDVLGDAATEANWTMHTISYPAISTPASNRPT
jgi:hypothetical protein